MQVDKSTIHKIAHLARLEFDPAAEAEMMKSMTTILDWMDKLNELDTTGVEPLIHLSAELNVLREDENKEPLPHERGLVNAPRKDSDYFRVPKVIE
ncbi:aspartyl-tRNA(Asn)/glutamyl-tRNA(Gln) amidotransferase subunit C [Flexibacter flexilis DSM 6793]|uniref:Aspartyl/glutamyl-tRNA(Asn/Gln) amidotransferase subunit C n=1 Tax=Flexibacter flexilis DSM 6793 TaxID=927664 RepID=A0A1I1FW07_9BACT|nr:Asp-tRNA(Asn)/Glu-tRNA(Gln) amidotransferase subunit GatC [Flexibacter flexilis]SFC03514.1 aspartyl-tRNA(Asn)/glutamyl-tRNA(Gln) amidotransferase subunit C [Flexibacter flexilis DSM 6793]